MQQASLAFTENIVYELRSLYNRYGYSQYKMSKFEEYDLYARNKDFLISDNVITFTDTNGKLMALKPDVTLSIVKNTPDTPNALQKVYYNENVYRVSKGSHTFKELMQVGLECIGAVDSYVMYEVLTLAAESLRRISPDFVLEVSHVGLLTDWLNQLGVSAGDVDTMLNCIGEKNLHELTRFGENIGLSADALETLKTIASACGTPSQVLPKLSSILPSEDMTRFSQIVNQLASENENVRINFSVVDDVHYYNGIVFKGYIAGVPSAVLSGGQYDKLMQKMNRRSKAIGFAVYVDLLDRLTNNTARYDVDVVLLYDDSAPFEAPCQHVRRLTDEGKRILTTREKVDVRYKTMMATKGSEVILLENNA